MSVPQSARRRLTRPLREAEALGRDVRNIHTLPIGQWAWNEHVTGVSRSLDSLATLLTDPPNNYNSTRDWIAKLLDARSGAISLLLAVEPFLPFDTEKANETLRLLESLTTEVADSVENETALNCSVGDLQEMAAWWAQNSVRNGSDDPLQTAFAMPEAPRDGRGEFRADWVLQHYAYKNDELLLGLLPHLASLGVPGVVDMLAAVSIVGWVVDCDDPVVAYAAMDAFVNRYLACNAETAQKVVAHLEDCEPALRRTRRAASRAITAAISASEDPEVRALALAEVYKRVIEGPFRQFSWGLYCLRAGTWDGPPMLTSLRARLIASGGLLAWVAKNAVLPDFRNSETHETLEWDGFSEEFVTENGRIPPTEVALALIIAESFAQGCEAGLAAMRTSRIQPDSRLPSSGEEARMPSWRRVQAFFGTNRLRLLDARLNTRHAFLRVDRLAFTDINPCFQALVLARRLLPEIETFSVSTTARNSPIIVVAAEALDAAMPAWEVAVSTLDQIPLSTFLPANLDARQRVESPTLAARSVAWIAADDVLGVLDGSPDSWSSSSIRLIQARLRVAQIALEQSSLVLESPSLRLDSVLRSVRDIREWLSSDPSPSLALIEREAAVCQLRTQWAQWGPVPRHPNIDNADAPDLSERQPKLLEPLTNLLYRTL